MSDKTYINGVFITEKTFNDGGSIIKLAIPEDKIDPLAEQLKFNTVNGWARLQISKMRKPLMSKKNPEKVMATHSLSVDDYAQQSKQEPASPEKIKDGIEQMKQAVKPAEETDDVPFN